MIRRVSIQFLVAVVIASIWTPSSAKAQSPAPAANSAKVEKAKSDTARQQIDIAREDSVSTADIERAAEQLAAAVQAAVKKATEDPAVKLAALKVAKNAVSTAQLVITQQAATLQSVLDTLASELAVASEKQSTKQKTH